MNLLLVLPILVPLVTAAGSFITWRWRAAQRALGVVGAASLLAATVAILLQAWQQGILVSQMGNWPAPFGITLVADLFSAIMLVLAGLMGLAVTVYSLVNVDARREAFGYYPLLQILLMGVCGAFLTGDMFNLFVWFEVMLIASFVLLTLGGERGQMEGGLKYVAINLISSAIFLTAIGILYGIAGTLNMADLAVVLSQTNAPGLVTTVAMLFLITFGVKAAVFPLFFWLPASYHTPPVAVSAIFAGLLTKVGVYALIRTFTLIFTQDVAYTHQIILVIAGITMVTGVLGAAAQNEMRRILSFHIVSQIGYMVMGLGLLTPLAVAGSVFYIMHHIIVKTNLFLVSGIVLHLKGTNELKDIGGLYRAVPGLAVLFLIPAFSLAGLPPLSGFWAKLALIRAGLEIEQYIITAVALAVGFLTLFSMIKIWLEAFWKPQPDKIDTATPALVLAPSTTRGWFLLVTPSVGLAAMTLLIGLTAEPLLVLAIAAADQLLNPSLYIQAVLGGSP